MRYAGLGSIPAKRHVQVRTDGDGSPLLVEEVMGYEGFSGNESILLHLQSPCRLDQVGEFRPIKREEWVPDAHVHRLADVNPVEPGGDPVSGRRLLMFNNDIEVSVCKLPEGEEQFWLCFHTPGEIETPNRYRNRYGQLLEHAPFSQRDFHPPEELETFDESGEFSVTVRVRGGYQDYVLDRHPFDVVGWDGYVWPYTFNADDFEPRAGRFHLPPPAHQTFQGPNFVICTFAPRMLDWDPQAVPIPYHHSNIQSEEVMFYAAGNYEARKGVEIGFLTLHPSGLPHGPQPGAVEKSLGKQSTDELAVMWDTFKPLRLSTLWRDVDRPEYAYSWNPEKAGADAGAATATAR